MIKTSMYEKVIIYADDFQMSTTKKKTSLHPENITAQD